MCDLKISNQNISAKLAFLFWHQYLIMRSIQDFAKQNKKKGGSSKSLSISCKYGALPKLIIYANLVWPNVF